MNKRNLKLVKKRKDAPNSVQQKRARSASKKSQLLDTRPVLVDVQLQPQNLSQAEEIEAERFRRLTLHRAALQAKVNRLKTKLRRRKPPKTAA